MEKLKRDFTIRLNAFEVGVLTATISKSDNKQTLINVFKQLLDIGERIRRQAGAKTETLPNGQLKMTDEDGNIIIRLPYEWET